MYSKIQYISQGSTANQQLNAIRKAIDAGCNWIQLRYKNVPEQEVLSLALKVKKALYGYDCTYIINDHPDVAKEVDADGLHLGLDDMPILKAREIIGPNKIIGGTANTLSHVVQRHEEGCNYIGLGPYRFTTTKEKLSPVLGIKGYSAIIAALKERDITTPVFAIGGIQEDDISPILQIGIYGVALSGLITNHENKKQLLTKLYTLCSSH